MANNFSFDIVSEVNFMEVDNAITQAQKELSQRYDFKGSKSSIDYNKTDKKITLIGDDDFKLKALIDIVEGKFAKRGVPLKSMLLKMLFGDFSSAFNLSFNKSFIFSCESMKSDFDIIKIFSSIFAINDFDMIHLLNKKNKKEINNIYVNKIYKSI